MNQIRVGEAGYLNIKQGHRKWSFLIKYIKKKYNIYSRGTAFLSSMDFRLSDPAAIFLSRSMCSAIIVRRREAFEPCTTATGSPSIYSSIG